MKTILVPTNFTATAKNALDYAAEIALYTRAKIVLIHVYNNTPPATDIPVILPIDPEIESSVKLELEKEKKRIERKFGDNLVSDIEFKWGLVIEEIDEYARKNHIDMVIIGMKGAGYLVERFLGTTASMLIKHCAVPVISISEKTKFKKIKKVLFATDGHKIPYKNVLKPLKSLLNTFKSHLFIVHVAPVLAPTIDIKRSGFEELEGEMEGIEHSFHYHISNEVVDDLNAFADKVNADMIVMIPHKHSIFDGILMEAYTKKMAFHTQLPLLSLHA